MYFPGIRKTQPIQSNLKVYGDFNIADILKPPFKNNFDAKYLKKESNIHIVEFIARNKDFPYQRQVLYFDDNNDLNLVKAEYFSRSNQILKTVFYTNYEEIDKRRLVSEMQVISVTGDKSIMKFSNYKPTNFNNNMFTTTGLGIVSETY